jgi:hypothetical protein
MDEESLIENRRNQGNSQLRNLANVHTLGELIRVHLPRCFQQDHDKAGWPEPIQPIVLGICLMVHR